MPSPAYVLDYTNERATEPATAGDYWQLLKPGVMALVVFTASIGLLVAPGEKLPLLQMFIALACIAMGSGAGAAFNMWYDADIDAIMHRTQKRPIPSGRVAAADVLVLSIGLALLSVGILGLATNWAAAALLAFAIWFYSCCYTMLLKRSTAQNIVIGGAAGAFPPVIGWLCVTQNLTLEPILYFAIIFFWTPPHFWALALYRNDDYTRANVPMLPVTHGIPTTLHNIVGYSIVLFVISLLPAIFDMRGSIYTISAIVLNAIFLTKAVILHRAPNDSNAMKLFGYSIFYLFVLFFAVIIDSLYTL